MENGSFRGIEKVDFQLPDLEEDFRQAPLTSSSSQNFLEEFQFKKSATVQALMAQNEDLMARLKVTLQRLTKEEDQVQALSKELNSLKQNHSTTSDLMLIWKEKERVWKERNEKLEKTCATFQEKLTKNLNSESRLKKYEKFHEKLKSQVKPYIRQLKEYAQSLQNEITSLNQELRNKDGKVAILTQDLQIARTLKLSAEENAQTQLNQLVDTFEKERSFLLLELKSLKEQNQMMTKKEKLLAKAEERVDELENQIIALRRHQEEQGLSYRTEIQTIRDDHRAIKQTMLQKDLECATQAEKIAQLSTENSRLAGKIQEAEDQVSSTRYLWKNKSDELEQLQLAMQSLERLNRELSQKLSESSFATTIK